MDETVINLEDQSSKDPNIVEIEKDDLHKEYEQKARRRARAKSSFLGHVIIFLFGVLGMFIYDALNEFDEWWFFPIAGGWAIGVIIHFLSVYIFDGILAGYEDGLVEREIRKLKK